MGKRHRHCLNLFGPDEAGAKPLSVEDALKLKPPRRRAPSTTRPLLDPFVRMLVPPCHPYLFHAAGLVSKCLQRDLTWFGILFGIVFGHVSRVYHSTDDFLDKDATSHAAMQSHAEAHSSPGCQSWKNSKPNRFLVHGLQSRLL